MIAANRASIDLVQRTSTLARADALPRAFWTLFAGQLVNQIGNMVVTVLVFFLRSAGLDVAGIGVVLTLLGIGRLLSQPIAGLLTDRYGPRLTLVAGMVATAGCTGMLGISRGLPMLAVVATALGLVGDLYRPAASVLVVEMVPATRRRQALGLLYWAMNLGYPVAALTAGWLANYGYWLLFAIDAVTCLAFAVIAGRGLPPTPQRMTSGEPVRFAAVLRDFRLVVVVLLTTIALVVYAQAWVGVPLAISGLGLPASSFAVVAAVNGIGVSVLQPVVGRLAARYAPMLVLGVSWLTVGVGLGLTGFARTTTQFALAAVIWTLGEALAGGVPAAIVADLAPPGAQGRYQALYGWGWALAKLVGAAVGAAAYATSPAFLWSGCLVVGLLCGLAAFVLARKLRR